MRSTLEYRNQIVKCRSCQSRGLVNEIGRQKVFMTPRFGLGCRDKPKLMIVGEKPPREPSRCLHGAGYRLFYGVETEEEIQVMKLLRKLGLSVRDIFATTAYKCPTHHDLQPYRFNAIRCGIDHLSYEIDEIKPEVILCIGMVASDATFNSWGHKNCNGGYKNYKFPHLDHTLNGIIREMGNVVEVFKPERHEWTQEVLDKFAETIKGLW